MQGGAPDLRDSQNGSISAPTANAVPGLGGPIDPVMPRPLAPETPETTTVGTAAAETIPTAAALDSNEGAAADIMADDHSSIYGEEDDAQSFIQPAISPMATRLSSPKTPAAEKAMAMDQVINASGGVGGFFDAYRPPVASRLQNATTAPPAQAPASAPVLAPASKPPASMASVFQSGTRHSRSSSVGSDALKRLSKALPSISFPSPSSFLPSLSSPSFPSLFSSSGGTSSSIPSSPPPSRKMSPRGSPTRAGGQRAPHSQQRSQLSNQSSEASTYSRRQPAAAVPPRSASPAVGSTDAPLRPPLHRPPSVASRRSHVLRRSTSDDSLLYHTLSRTSSHGDEDQFEHIREQVNSRVKAIMDSFDRPSFKMPQLPSFFPDGKGSAGTSAPREPASPLDAALESLTGDIVVLGGYRGSILRSAEPPHRQLWVPVKVGLKIRKVNMEVGLDPEDEETMRQHIFPSGMLKHIGPVDISRRLFKKLRESDNARKGTLRVHDYGYDWRLSPHRLSKELIAFLETLPCNKGGGGGTASQGRGAVVIAHSLGGLITRHAVNARPDLFAGVVFAGTPQRCVNILGPLRNGDAVLLNEKVLTAQVNFSLRTTFAFLPEDGFCFVNSKDPTEEYRVDFYDVNEWLHYRWSPCVAPAALPPFQLTGGGGGGDANPNLKRSSTIFSRALLEDLSGSLPSLPLRNRHNSSSLPPAFEAQAAAAAVAKERLLAPHMDKESSASTATTAVGEADDDAAAAAAPGGGGASNGGSSPDGSPSPLLSEPATPPIPSDPQRARAVAYLTRTLADTKRFRAELAHRPEHTAANAYPPLAVIYGKGTPTVYAARVESRAAIACADAYDALVFRTGDGVVLAREALLPPGYHYARDGYVSTDRGHVGMLGDLNAVGRALEAVVRGRQKGIGLGLGPGGRGIARRATLAGQQAPRKMQPAATAATSHAPPSASVPPAAHSGIEATS